MPRPKDVQISAMLGGGSDEDVDMSDGNLVSDQDSSIENIEPPKKAKTNRTAGKGAAAPKTKASAQRTKATSTAKRTALQEQTDGRNVIETEGPDTFDDDDDADMLDQAERARRGRHSKAPKSDTTAAKSARSTKLKPEPKAKGAPKGRRPAAASTAEEPAIEELEEPLKKSRVKKTVNTKQPKRQPPLQPQVPDIREPETQEDTLEGDADLQVSADIEEEEHEEPRRTASAVARARSTSKTRQPSVSRKRGASASDTERGGGGGDPAVRRKLGEMTKKFQNLDLKYRNLREVGVKEAEVNFDRLRKQSEERVDAANKLISSLKGELATQSSLAKESRSLQKKLSGKDDEIAKLQAEVAQLNASLSESKNETKSLTAKLAANRAAPVSSTGADTLRASANATKNGQRNGHGGNAEAIQALQVAQLKEDLYSDLTGLILRGIKSSEQADVYDCIQTGRNGTLHFKLAIASTSASKDKSYEETEVTFTPLLDPSRDSALLELLPEYLTEEITFARNVAAKFYGRLADCLTKAN